MKGISQEKRDAKWHRKHLLKLSEYKRHRVHRLAMYREGGGRIEMSRAEREFKLAQAREKGKVIGFWGRLILYIKRLFSFNKTIHANA